MPHHPYSAAQGDGGTEPPAPRHRAGPSFLTHSSTAAPCCQGRSLKWGAASCRQGGAACRSRGKRSPSC